MDPYCFTHYYNALLHSISRRTFDYSCPLAIAGRPFDEHWLRRPGLAFLTALQGRSRLSQAVEGGRRAIPA
jgi:hypothetical protein